MTKMVEKNSIFRWRRLWPIALLAAVAGLAFGLGVEDYVTLEALRVNHRALADFVEGHALEAVLLYMSIYIVSTALSLPCSTILTLAGAYLFGAAPTVAYAIVSATLGASVLFLTAKSTLGEPLRRRARGWVKRMEEGFGNNALSYLLFLRLVPVFPFFVVNLVPAFLGVRLSTFVIATFIGIIPGTAVYALAGAGLGQIFASGGEFDLAAVLSPQLIAGLAGLAVFALLPVVYKKWKTHRRPVP